MASSGFEVNVPLEQRRPFGSGLRRKQVIFVPASSEQASAVKETKKPSTSIPDVYLSLVLPEDVAGKNDMESASNVCDICKLPLDTSVNARPHEASIAHQVCLQHSHPPSALDRSRMGLKVLQAQGWDPDSRKGFGPNQEGIQLPIKPVAKHDTLGLGVQVPKSCRSTTSKKTERKVQKLDARQTPRRQAAEDRRRHERIRQEFYGNPDIERYLGHG
ncbi:hypothetical protein F5Y16DRAFT_399317 [Xylariaceae sp. FL0255]|nr:hypothetical protein F5Y16DRAFT_399317 [Xylariaceae sp. FL0255]